MTTPATLTRDKFAEAAEILALSDRYKVLRRFEPDPADYLADRGAVPPDCKEGLFVDVETTGLDTRADRIISLALVPFVFDAHGAVHDAGKGVSYLQSPGVPLTEEIVALTGLTDEMLDGQAIDWDQVGQLIDPAAIVVSHHAAFDRKMLERASPLFATKAWGCSWKDVPWQESYGTRAGRLGIILSDVCRQFHEAHRAVDDCHVGVHLLANAVADSRTALSFLLASARKFTYRVWAVGSEFMAKDKLKARGYEWSPAETGRKCWFRDVHADEVEEELIFARDIASATPTVQKFNAIDRYSRRVD